MEIKWSQPGKDEITLNLRVSNESIAEVRYQCSGSLDFLRFSKEQAHQLKGKISDLKAPDGKSPSAIIWREIIAKIQGQWSFPLSHEELCHCRRVSAKAVDTSIVYGAHTLEEIRRRTSANTGCGTCLPDLETLLELRL